MPPGKHGHRQPVRTSGPSEPSPAVLFRIFSLEVTWRRLTAGCAALAVVAGLMAFGHLIDIKAVHEKAREMPGWVALVLLLFLPLAGFPVSLLHVAAGVRFGIVNGLIAVGAATYLQHILAWALVRIAPQTFEKKTQPLEAAVASR